MHYSKGKLTAKQGVIETDFSERSDHTDYYEMGESGAETSADIYNEIIPDCKPGIGNTNALNSPIKGRS